jgi:hypothetical protein
LIEVSALKLSSLGGKCAVEFPRAEQLVALCRRQHHASPERKRPKVDMALLRESYENCVLGAVIWVEITAQLAYAMTNANENTDSRLLLALADGVLRHPYDTCPVFSDLNGAKGSVVKDKDNMRFSTRN